MFSKYNISSLSEGESPHSFILFWLKHGVHYNSFLILSPIVWGHPVSSPDRALSSSSTQIAICCPHFRYIQYNINALYCFFRRCGPLLEMLLYQRLVSFHFLLIQKSPYQLGSSRLANSRIFNLCICSIYCFGVFSIILLTRHFHRQWSKGSLEPDGLLVTQRVQSWIRYRNAWGLLVSSVLSSFLLSFQILVVYAGLMDLFLLHMHFMPYWVMF